MQHNVFVYLLGTLRWCWHWSWWWWTVNGNERVNFFTVMWLLIGKPPQK